MKTSSTDRAKGAAIDVLRAAWVNEIPVDPIQIAREMGIRVVETNLEEDVSGAVAKEPGRPATIYIERNDHKNQQRFSCAHQLGHIVARPNDEEFAWVDFRDSEMSYGTDPAEVYANAFAANLLMPENAVHQLHTEFRTTAALAVKFGVSPQAMDYRLQNLGYELTPEEAEQFMDAMEPGMDDPIAALLDDSWDTHNHHI